MQLGVAQAGVTGRGLENQPTIVVGLSTGNSWL
jgi:hypothetical protein